MQESLQKKFTPEYMAYHFKTLPAFQNYLSMLTYDRARKQGRNYNSFASSGLEESAHSRILAEKQQLETDIPTLRSQIEVALPGAYNLKELKHDLYTKERKLQDIEESLASSTFQEAGSEWMNFHFNEQSIKVMDALAVHLIDWFKEGHLGPGTVEYNNVKYTVE